MYIYIHVSAVCQSAMDVGFFNIILRMSPFTKLRIFVSLTDFLIKALNLPTSF